MLGRIEADIAALRPSHVVGHSLAPNPSSARHLVRAELAFGTIACLLTRLCTHVVGPCQGREGMGPLAGLDWLAVVLAAGRESWGGEGPDDVAGLARMHPFGPRGWGPHDGEVRTRAAQSAQRPCSRLMQRRERTR
jgi:hypothetical protein